MVRITDMPTAPNKESFEQPLLVCGVITTIGKLFNQVFELKEVAPDDKAKLYKALIEFQEKAIKIVDARLKEER